jgi:hypothetical protein
MRRLAASMDLHPVLPASKCQDFPQARLRPELLLQVLDREKEAF